MNALYKSFPWSWVKYFLICNLRFRNDKNELRQKLKGQDMLLEEKKKISEISKISILPYT